MQVKCSSLAHRTGAQFVENFAWQIGHKQRLRDAVFRTDNKETHDFHDGFWHKMLVAREDSSGIGSFSLASAGYIYRLVGPNDRGALLFS